MLKINIFLFVAALWKENPIRFNILWSGDIFCGVGATGVRYVSGTTW
jgi:hypothetical protein